MADSKKRTTYKGGIYEKYKQTYRAANNGANPPPSVEKKITQKLAELKFNSPKKLTKAEQAAQDQATEEWGNRYMYQAEAEQKQKEALATARAEAQLNKAKADQVARIAKATGAKPSAVVQNNPILKPSSTKNKKIAPGVYADPKKTGVYYDKHGSLLSKEDVDRLLKEDALAQAELGVAADKRKAKLKSDKDAADPLKKYIKNTQALLFNHLDRFSTEQFLITGDQNIYRIPMSDQKAGSFNQRLATKGMYADCKNPFLRATPAQLASLMPLLRFYIVDKKGNQKEIYFSDKVSAKHIKDVAELKGKSIDQIMQFNAAGKGEVGIQSFEWNYNNKHEGDFIIEAQLQLYFGSLLELANADYLQFLFPTGNSVDYAASLKKGAEKQKQQKSKPPTRQTIATKLSNQIAKYTQVLERGNDELQKLVNENNEQLLGSSKKDFRQLKVVVGWSLPEGNEAELQKLFPDGDLACFRKDIKNTHTAILLNLANYDVDFTQEGPTVLTLSYVGSSDNYLATDSSDIFGSNNFNANSKIMYEDTLVSVGGINVKDNTITPAKAASGKGSNKSSTSVEKLMKADPYLNQVQLLAYGTKLKDSFGEAAVKVQLAGLRLAQELVALELKKLEVLNADPEGEKVKALQRRGQYIVILYNRALEVRLRTMYAQFLDDLLNQRLIRRADVIVADGSIKLVTNPKAMVTRQVIESHIAKMNKFVQDTIAAGGFAGKVMGYLASGTKSNASSNKAGASGFSIYYMFLGDLIQVMMKNADLRDDITLLLGNYEDVNEKSHSIYKIPITLDSFGQFFFNRIVATKLSAYPFRTFLNDFLNYTARLMNLNSQTSERIAFDYTVISSTFRKVKGGKNKLLAERTSGKKTKKASDLDQIRTKIHDPLSNLSKPYQNYYAIFSKKTSIGKRTGSFKGDLEDGIFHYVVGSDRGLAKKFNFSRQDTRYFQEMLIESNNPSDRIQALFLPQNVEIEMYGNGIHRNGDLIFVDTRAALGAVAGQILGIGGYYRVIRCQHKISPEGYNTNLTCVFELRQGQKKKKKKKQASKK